MVELKRIYELLRRKHGSYELYNLMEKCLIEVPLTVAETKTAKDIDVERLLIKEIKGLAMQLSRYKPADWNKFLDVVTK